MRRPCVFYSETGSNTQGAIKLHGPVWPLQRRSDSTALVWSEDTRRYLDTLGQVDRGVLDSVIRFGETLDQGLTKSIAWYVSKVTESRGLLLGVLGHDMRTPLGAARMSAQFLLQTEALNSDQTKAVVRIVNSTSRMRSIVDDLLDFTKTALGVKLPISAAPFDIGAVCAEVIAEVGALHPARVIGFERIGDLNGNWDSARIAQLVTNLVSNAVQHGDSKFPVTVVAQAEGNGVSICVHNFGSLVSPESRATLFDPLKQNAQTGADRHTGSSGLGLGLYIAEEIAIAHGGTIEVTSTEQDGTSFIARLPRVSPIPA